MPHLKLPSFYSFDAERHFDGGKIWSDENIEIFVRFNISILWDNTANLNT